MRNSLKNMQKHFLKMLGMLLLMTFLLSSLSFAQQNETLVYKDNQICEIDSSNTLINCVDVLEKLEQLEKLPTQEYIRQVEQISKLVKNKSNPK